MFWEHTLAVLLATGGTVALLEGGVHSRPRRNLIVAGVALGLAIWFRPESYVFAGACAAAFPILARSPDRRRRLLYFMSALVVTVVIHWAINFAVYRHPFGIQSLQVLESAPASQYQTDYASLFKIVADLLYDYMRPSLFCLIAAPIALAMTRKTEATRRIGFLFVVSLVFFFAVPLILPNYGGKQWGPRFYLLFMPLISVQIAWALGVMVGRDMIWQAIGLSSFAYCLLAGGRINAYDGTRALASDYADRILPSLRFLRESNHKTILVARQWIPMDLQAALPDKQFFRLARWERLEEVVPVLLDHGRESFLVVLDRDDAFPKNGNFMSAGRRVEIRFRSLGILGAYEILEGVASNAE